MRGVVWLILLFTVAVVAATALGQNDGLVTLAWGEWRVELSLNLFLVLVLGACALLMVVLRGMHALLTLPRRAGEWRALQRERAAQAALRQALVEYFAARYSRGHRAARRALTILDDAPGLPGAAETRILAQLLAAGSLHRLRDAAQRDALLQGIEETPRSADTRAAAEGARLLAAEWALDDRDADRALALLSTLPPGVARRTQALRLRLQAARLAQHPLEALNTARLLAKHQAFTAEAARGLLRALAIDVLETARDGEQLRREWAALDAADRRDAAVAARAATLAVGFGAHDSARAWLAPFWDSLGELLIDDLRAVALATCGATPGVDIDWLPRVEGAWAALPGEPAIAAAAGMMLAERQLWGKARRLLELAAADGALDGTTRRRCWRKLAELAREEADETRAQQCDRAAAAIA